MSKNLLTVVMLASFLLQCLLGVGEAAVVPTSLVSIHNGATVDGPGQIVRIIALRT